MQHNSKHDIVSTCANLSFMNIFPLLKVNRFKPVDIFANVAILNSWKGVTKLLPISLLSFVMCMTGSRGQVFDFLSLEWLPSWMVYLLGKWTISQMGIKPQFPPVYVAPQHLSDWLYTGRKENQVQTWPWHRLPKSLNRPLPLPP